MARGGKIHHRVSTGVLVARITAAGVIGAALIASLTNIVIEGIRRLPTATPLPIAAQTATAFPTVPPNNPAPAISPPSWPPESSTTCTDTKAPGSVTARRAPQSDRPDAIGLQFNVNKNGYSCWIIPLNGYDASRKKMITFWVKGEKGGEEYEVGIKDKITPAGQEPKVPETASAAWTNVSIDLTDFEGQDLSALENVSVNFTIAGSGTIYIDQLIFTP